MNVQEITEKAEDFVFNPLVALRYWVRTSNTLLKEVWDPHHLVTSALRLTSTSQAEIYEREGNDQQAYQLYFRQAKLVLDYLPRHPDAKKPDLKTKAEFQRLKKGVPKSLAKLEALKPRINDRYNKYQENIRKLQDTQLGQDEVPSGSASITAGLQEHDMSLMGLHKISDPAVSAAVHPIAAAENGDLAVRLAHREIKRREAARRAVRQAGVSAAEEQERRTAGVWDNWEADAFLAGEAQNGDDDDLRARIQETHQNVEAAGDRNQPSRNGEGIRSSLQASRSPSRSYNYQYPSVPKPRTDFEWMPQSPVLPPTIPQPLNEDTPVAPMLPPKIPQTLELQVDNSPTLEFRQDNLPSYEEIYPVPPRKEPLQRVETPAHDIKPSEYTFKPAAYLENGDPLRTIFLPADLRQTFLKIAAPNTAANLETCGVLCGTLISNALFISHLVIPEQTSTSDYCETVNEAALFEYCEAEDLMVFGWIHTHPTQTCFMSSRDLHTHFGYQVSMPESIAIVCAPSKDPS
jgi:STAM-binding protein